MSSPAPSASDDATRRDRQLGMLCRMEELGMELAEDAAAQAKLADPTDRSLPDHRLGFARVTHSVRESIKLENRVAAGDAPSKQPGQRAPRPVPTPDSRRGPLRQALYDMAKGEPDRTARNQMRRLIEERVEDALLADPDHRHPLAKPFMSICAELGLRVDVSQLSDEFLGMAPRTGRPPGPPPPQDPS